MKCIYASIRGEGVSRITDGTKDKEENILRKSFQITILTSKQKLIEKDLSWIEWDLVVTEGCLTDEQKVEACSTICLNNLQDVSPLTHW